MYFEPADFTSFTKRILKNAGIQKTVNAAAPFGMGSIDITGFEGQKFSDICWSSRRLLKPEKFLRSGRTQQYRNLLILRGSVSLRFPSRNNTASISQYSTLKGIKTSFFQPILVLLFCIRLTFVIDINIDEIKFH